MYPGQTALTRIPSPANCAAIDRVSPSNPAFEAQYAGMKAWPTIPSIDEMPTTAAPGPLVLR